MVILLRRFFSGILCLLHFVRVRTDIVMMSRAIARAVAFMVAGAIFMVFDAIFHVFPVSINNCAILTILNVLFRQALTLHISLNPEVGEKHKKEGAIHPDEVNNYWELVVTTVHEVILGGME